MSRVIMIDDLRKEFDLSDAKRFGEIVSIANRLPSPFRIEEYENALLDALRDLNFDSNKDFLLLVGRSYNLVVAISLLARRFKRGIHALVWSATEAHYIERVL